MNNLEIYDKSREVPKEAQKAFNNGKFSGTDINPMWRIKKLTELFGPAGIGWYYEVISERAEEHGDVTIAVVDLNLYILDPVSGEWSKPIYGTGGNVLLRKGNTSDEGYKMALTDALGVACKALGIGADVYFEKDRTKYTSPENTPKDTPPKATTPKPDEMKAEITGILDKICETEEQRNIAIATWTKKKDGTCSVTVDEISDELLPAVLDKAKKQYKKKTGEDYKAA